MAYYAYKSVRDLIPSDFQDKFEVNWKELTGREYEGTADYDGDLWSLTAEYIRTLQDRIEELESK